MYTGLYTIVLNNLLFNGQQINISSINLKHCFMLVINEFKPHYNFNEQLQSSLLALWIVKLPLKRIRNIR